MRLANVFIRLAYSPSSQDVPDFLPKTRMSLHSFPFLITALPSIYFHFYHALNPALLLALPYLSLPFSLSLASISCPFPSLSISSLCPYCSFLCLFHLHSLSSSFVIASISPIFLLLSLSCPRPFLSFSLS